MRGLDARRRHDGVDLPRLTIAVSRGDYLTAETVVGQPGVRTHGSLALMLGAAERVRQSPRRARRAPGRLDRPRTNVRQQRGADPPPSDPQSSVPIIVGATATCPAESSARARDGGGQRLRAHTGGHQRHPRSSQHRRPHRARQSRNELLTGVAGGSWPSQRAACGITRGGHVLRQVCGLQ